MANDQPERTPQLDNALSEELKAHFRTLDSDIQITQSFVSKDTETNRFHSNLIAAHTGSQGIGQAALLRESKSRGTSPNRIQAMENEAKDVSKLIQEIKQDLIKRKILDPTAVNTSGITSPKASGMPAAVMQNGSVTKTLSQTPDFCKNPVGGPAGEPLGQENLMQQPLKSVLDPKREALEFNVEKYADGSHYVGNKRDGVRHGKGKYYYADGGWYDGEWKADLMDGHGILYYDSGTIAFEGEWKGDKFHGKGILANEKPEQSTSDFDYRDFDKLKNLWIKFDGEFCNDNKEGFGTLWLTNGERYVGQFKDDFVHGSGTYFTKDGRKIQGVWDRNKIIQMVLSH
jgi:hypothetical protein